MSYRRSWRDIGVTWILIGVTVLVFIAETLTGGSQSSQVLFRFGANMNWLVRQGDWWRLIMPIFIHIGFMHLAVNMFTLYYIGGMLEQIIGHWRFALIYILSGISGNLMSFAFSRLNSLSAGASTSLFGLFGVYIALGVVFKDNLYFRQTGRQFATLAIFNFVIDLFANGIDIWGHVGGLIGGFILLLATALPQQRQRQGRWLAPIAILGFLAICGLLLRIGLIR